MNDPSVCLANVVLPRSASGPSITSMQEDFSQQINGQQSQCSAVMVRHEGWCIRSQVLRLQALKPKQEKSHHPRKAASFEERKIWGPTLPGKKLGSMQDSTGCTGIMDDRFVTRGDGLLPSQNSSEKTVGEFLSLSTLPSPPIKSSCGGLLSITSRHSTQHGKAL